MLRTLIYPCTRLTAHLHDVLLYRPGDFFVKHTDSLKSPRHLLTMSVVVALSGCGEATGDVQFPTLSTTWQGRAGGDWCAWYTSEEHAVTPLTGDGHRVVATYIVEELPVAAVEVDGERNMELGIDTLGSQRDDVIASVRALCPVLASQTICPFLPDEVFAALVFTRRPPFDSRHVCQTLVASCLPKFLREQGSVILFLKHAYSPRVFPETAASADTAAQGGGNVTVPMWQLRAATWRCSESSRRRWPTSKGPRTR